MQVNGRIFDPFVELKVHGFKWQKLEDGKYKVQHRAKDVIDEREFIFETLDELQAFVEGLMLGIMLEFEAEKKINKGTNLQIYPEIKDAADILYDMVDRLPDGTKGK